MARPILTAAEMRAAEESAIAGGTTVELLMERAGFGVAEAAWRFAGPIGTLVLCGPGNNGGDGYVAARYLAERGMDVCVAAVGEPKAGAAAAARAVWRGPVVSIEEARPAPLLVDALFGTGLSRGLDDGLAARLRSLADAARVRVAVDLPSGVDTDTGALLSPVPVFDLTVTFATLKPAHLLQPAAARCGRIVTVDIGIEAKAELNALERPDLPPPGPEDHKYTRGMVAGIGGAMPGAGELAALAAAHAGAGYVLLLESEPRFASPHAIVRRVAQDPARALADERIGAVVIGPGLGGGSDAERALAAALDSGRSLVIDGDALHLLGGRKPEAPAVLTPHEGEFRAIFPDVRLASKVDRARTAAARSGAVIIYKGADTVVAAPDGRAVLAGEASTWLSTAGTGDVLAGAVAAMLARGLAPFEAARAAVWLHGEAARRAGSAFLADDLARRLSDCL
ncbi:NAD(P)H-hydrate dehydratase [Sphingomonas sp. MAH-20]|uniref:Bifunctional NAD(P)H-hydrate repair enzyme n=1 Tax=Sphingomonas horti TaxID=2682842 RepID=A0A6I4IWG7_9SPHN|nr:MULTISPECIES: NAD(P)H-hydrate dehydratase [Sphingomonas]MBA2920248.1 NAD(P)H-hydrate dehydratase [Sphingomonas sp. CGMCC 1.13658]MVO76502.1 NAD(P)H-hydrate dehydratase [Sphingomonas horti]